MGIELIVFSYGRLMPYHEPSRISVVFEGIGTLTLGFLRRSMLYPAELQTHIETSGWQDSNSRPLVPNQVLLAKPEPHLMIIYMSLSDIQHYI